MSSSNGFVHRSRLGESIGTLTASTDEVLGIAQAIERAGHGVVQLISDAPGKVPLHMVAELVHRLDAIDRGNQLIVEALRDLPTDPRASQGLVELFSRHGLSAPDAQMAFAVRHIAGAVRLRPADRARPPREGPRY